MQVAFGGRTHIAIQGKGRGGGNFWYRFLCYWTEREDTLLDPPPPHFRSAGSRLKTTPSAAKEWDMAEKRDDSPSNCCQTVSVKPAAKMSSFFPFSEHFIPFYTRACLSIQQGKVRGKERFEKLKSVVGYSQHIPVTTPCIYFITTRHHFRLESLSMTYVVRHTHL